MRINIKYSRIIARYYFFEFFMSKERDFYREILRLFVSGSMYILMFIVAIFIFYKTIVLFFFVWSAILLHIKEFDFLSYNGLKDSSALWIRLAEQVLNIVTFILVLVKSFKILVEYSKHQHIAIKDLVEISIIALLMEVVFNFWIHSMQINILFAIFWATLLVIYAWFPYFREDHYEELDHHHH